MLVKKCEYCGKEFEANRPNQIYCSRACSIRKYRNRRVEEIRASCTTTKGKSLLEWCNENGERGSLILSEYSSKNEQPADKIAAGSNKKVYWKCGACGHEWAIQLANRTLSGTGCRSCAGHILETNNLYLWCMKNGERGQRILSEYSSKNEWLPEEIAPISDKKVYWKCSACGFEWETQIQCRTRSYNGCPSCAGFICETNNLYLWCMKNGERGQRLLSEYSSKNKLSPEEIAPMSDKKVYWECSTCGHSWITSLSNRVHGGTDCPKCDKTQTSYGEQILYYILQRELKAHKVLNRAKVEGYEIDVFVPDLKFGIEYSGYNYHVNKVEQDKIKKEALKDAGYNVITILERYATDNELGCDFSIIRNGVLNPDEILYCLKSYLKENYNLDIDVSLSADERKVCKEQSVRKYIDIDEVILLQLSGKTTKKIAEILNCTVQLLWHRKQIFTEYELDQKKEDINCVYSLTRFGDSAEKIATDFELDLDFVKKIQSFIKKYSVL